MATNLLTLDLTAEEDLKVVGTENDALGKRIDSKKWTRGRRRAPKESSVSTYVITADDENRRLIRTNSSTGYVDIPTDTAEPDIPIGAKFLILRKGSGALQVRATTGLLPLLSGGKTKLRVTGSSATLEKIGANEWLLEGDTIA